MADGLIDLRKDTDYVTVSNNLLSEHNKAFGIGWTDNVISKVTVSFHLSRYRTNCDIKPPY